MGRRIGTHGNFVYVDPAHTITGMHFHRRPLGSEIATVVATPGPNRYGGSVRHAVFIDKSKHLVCTCGGEAMYHEQSPKELGHLCGHIQALYPSKVTPQPLVRFTPRGHKLFDFLWAEHALMKE